MRGSPRALLVFLGRRVVYSAVVLLGVMVVTFAIVQLVPGDPIRLALGTRYNPEAYQALLEASGLDRPLPEQFFSYIAGALTGDLGVSFRSGQPVTVLLIERLPATVSLAVPTMILSETALSFLGLGLQAPAVSWGVLLQDAQSVSVVANAPWLLLPGMAVVVAVVAFNFVGDGLRDSADPYGKR